MPMERATHLLNRIASDIVHFGYIQVIVLIEVLVTSRQSSSSRLQARTSLRNSTRIDQVLKACGATSSTEFHQSSPELSVE